ncbi:MAG: hypothetical protein ACK48W_13455 [Bacteroidota bacterium]|jgi:hypothetical protein
MPKNIVIPIQVNKESIAMCEFPAEDVLNAKDKEALVLLLENATKLGNMEHSKIKIVFEDSDAVKQVETTVWATTDKRVVLKGGIVIPINRIHQIVLV